jgi:2-isopropylmalate synthase
MEYFVSFLMRSNDVNENAVILKSMLLLVVNLFHPAIFQNIEHTPTLNPEVENIIIKMRSQKYLASSLNEITADCHYSYMQLTRIFKNETGMTMQEFFSNIKMQYAVSQLLLTNRLILDISNDIGITSLSHFNHLFKSKYGVSPSQYRNRRNFQ